MIRWGLIAALVLAFILVPFVLWEDVFAEAAADLAHSGAGAPIVFAGVAALLALDIVLPVPSSIVGVMAGALLGVAAGTAAVWLGLMTGSVLGYWIGRTGGAAAARRIAGDGALARAAALAERYGAGTVAITRAVPVLAEAAVLMAGTMAMPTRRFLIAAALANLGAALVYAVLGATSAASGTLLPATAGAIVIPLAAWAVVRLMTAMTRARR